MKKSYIPFPLSLLRFWFGQILWLWLIIGFFIFIIQIIQCSIVQDNQKVQLILQWTSLMPSFITTMLGEDLLSGGTITGFIALTYQYPLVLTSYMIFVVCIPSGLLAGNVQNGTMELILSRSVTKNQVYICAFILTFAGMLGLVALMFFGTVVGISICNFDQEISLLPFMRAAGFGGLLSSTTAGVALLAAATFRTRNRAVGLAIAFFIINYFIDVIAEWWPKAEFMGPLSIFYYFDMSAILNGTAWPIRDICVLGSIWIVTVIAGGIIWNRRDLPL